MYMALEAFIGAYFSQDYKTLLDQEISLEA